MTSPAPSYHGYRFPPEIISHAVWLYHRFCLSFRDTEDLLLLRIHGEPGGGNRTPNPQIKSYRNSVHSACQRAVPSELLVILA